MCVKMIDLHIYLYGGLSYDSLHNLDCVVTGKKNPVLHQSVDFILLSFGIIDSILEL